MEKNQQPKQVTAKEMLFEAFTQDNGAGGTYVTLEIEIMHEKICKVMQAFAKVYHAQQNSLQKFDAVFVQRFIGKEEFPHKTGLYHTDLGRINWFEGLKSFEHSARVEYWLEPLTVPFVNDVRWRLGEGFMKEVLGKYTKEEISFGRMVEMLNEQIQSHSSTSDGGNKRLPETVAEVKAYEHTGILPTEGIDKWEEAKKKIIGLMSDAIHLKKITPIIEERIDIALRLFFLRFPINKNLEELRDWALDVEMNSTSREIHLFARQVKEKIIELLCEQFQSKMDFAPYDKERFPETVEEVKEYERTGILPKERLTIQQCKDKVAQKYGYKDWSDLAKQADRPLEYLKEIRALYHS